jgi:signal transduction histidine kinase
VPIENASKRDKAIHMVPSNQPPNPVHQTIAHPVAQTEGKSEIDLEMVNARLRELDELKTTFVALVSHELRTPVQLVIGFLDMGLESLDPNTPVETRQFFETARVQGSRLMRIIQELTDFAHLQRTQSVEITDPISIGDALTQVLTLLGPSLRTKQITPAIDLPDDILETKFDGESLIIIFRNLLSNSAKFTSSGGRVWIKGIHSITDGAITISINDTAAPIPPEKRETIFSDFRQMENYLTRRYEGLGLGLAVAHHTARSLGGDIYLNVRPDGNTFSVSLPIKR